MSSYSLKNKEEFHFVRIWGGFVRSNSNQILHSLDFIDSGLVIWAKCSKKQPRRCIKQRSGLEIAGYMPATGGRERGERRHRKMPSNVYGWYMDGFQILGKNLSKKWLFRLIIQFHVAYPLEPRILWVRNHKCGNSCLLPYRFYALRKEG